MVTIRTIYLVPLFHNFYLWKMDETQAKLKKLNPKQEEALARKREMAKNLYEKRRKDEMTVIADAAVERMRLKMLDEYNVPINNFLTSLNDTSSDESEESDEELPVASGTPGPNIKTPSHTASSSSTPVSRFQGKYF
jgi:hypothetical protein